MTTQEIAALLKDHIAIFERCRGAYTESEYMARQAELRRVVDSFEGALGAKGANGRGDFRVAIFGEA